MDITVWKYQPEHFLAVWEGLSALRNDMITAARQEMAKEYAIRFFAYHDYSMVMERGSVMEERLKVAKAESAKGVMDWQYKVLPKVEVFLPTDWSAIFCVGLNNYRACEELMSAQLWWSKLGEPAASSVLESLGGVGALDSSWRLQWINPRDLFVPDDWINYAPDINKRAEHLAQALLHQASGDMLPKENLTEHPQFLKLVDKLTKIMTRHDQELQDAISKMWPQQQSGRKIGAR